MPIYEYRCDSCNAEFEKRVARAEDSASVVCPSCGAGSVTQRWSVFATVTQGRKESSAPACPAAGSCPSGTCGLNMS